MERTTIKFRCKRDVRGMIKYFKYFIIFLFSITHANALIEVDITRGNLNPLPIAVSPLSIDSNSNEALQKTLKKKNIGSEISKVVENNLKTSGLFNPLSKDAFLQKPDIAHLKPRFEDWSLIKAQALITGKVIYQNEKLRVEFRLWDVLAGKEMMALPQKDESVISPSTRVVNYQPRPGDLYIFPSYLPHEYVVSRGGKFRFIHFNIQAVSNRMLNSREGGIG